MANKNIKDISLGAYHVIGKIVGSETDVNRRQTSYLIRDMLQNAHIAKIVSSSLISSGSRAEGLEFSTSDEDIMIELKYVKVIESFTQPLELDQSACFLMENNVTRPGFTFLRVISYSSLVEFGFYLANTEHLGDACYLSNTKWKQSSLLSSSSQLLNISSQIWNCYGLDLHLHGPCFSGVLMNGREIDLAKTFRCYTWPTIANGCITRLIRRDWPSYDVIKRIVEGGCLFVAVGSKGSQYEHLEWRISFSLAEKELVHAMNHTQVMCYACLKIFLKEAINVEESVKDLLCSYFLKTAVFWEITDGRQDWTGDNYLQCFWRCFTRLLGWVNNGYCPNFFIPQNNMFLGKIHGQAREQLLHHLSNLYSEGYECLLRCTSIRESFNTIIERPTLAVHLTQANSQDKAYTDVQVIKSALIVPSWTNNGVTDINNISQKMMMRTNDVHRMLCKLTLQGTLSYNVLSLVFNVGDRHCLNNKLLCKLFRLMKQSIFDAARYQIFLALYFLRYHMYDEALCRVHSAMLRLQNPSTMYEWDIDESRYRAAGGNRTPIHVMMRRYVAFVVILTARTCMPELLLEYSFTGPYSTTCNYLHPQATFPLHPLVLLHFIKFLCYHHKSDHQSAQSVLGDLSTLVYHIPYDLLPISYEILGICQEMYGDFQGALSSYMAVFSHPFSANLKYATEVRIRGLVEKMR